jgi:hypothetical protein
MVGLKIGPFGLSSTDGMGLNFGLNSADWTWRALVNCSCRHSAEVLAMGCLK